MDGENGPNGLDALALASVVRNLEDELTSAPATSMLNKLHAVMSATGWPGLPGPAAPRLASVANDPDRDSILAALRLSLLIHPLLPPEKSRLKLAVLSALTVSGLDGPDALSLAAVELLLATDTTSATVPLTLKTLCATMSAAQPGTNGLNGLLALSPAAEAFRTEDETMSALPLPIKPKLELATLNSQIILTAHGLSGLFAPNPAEVVPDLDLPSTFATLPVLSILKLVAILASGWNGKVN